MTSLQRHVAESYWRTESKEGCSVSALRFRNRDPQYWTSSLSSAARSTSLQDLYVRSPVARATFCPWWLA